MLALFFYYFFSLLLPTDDHSRVVLSHLDGHPCSDYINASYIDVNLGRRSDYRKFNLTSFWGKKLPLTPEFCFPSQGFKEKNKFIAAQGKYMNYSSTVG